MLHWQKELWGVLPMPAPMPEREFYKLLKKHGCRFERRTKHYSIFFGDRFVSGFSVTHSKGGKKEVLPNAP
jgi:hypothetical protein